MPRFHTTLLLPGNEITAMAELIVEGQVPSRPATEFLGGPYEGRFNNSYVIRVVVLNTDPPSIHAALYDQGDTLLEEQTVPEPLDQDYVFEQGDNNYQLSILRAANTVLVDDEVKLYIEQGGVRCPFCGSDDLHTGRLQTDAGIAWQRVECCSCEARWKDQYNLTDIDRDEDSWEPPQANVQRAP